eukprot:CAMPEP_0206042616 /NCGR_PEP_ID=MMETSP1466-20131121/6662_1 /ASSEMBLY_ACC=CAM_ASM_001126 /TAXON_ID=44452 /ORGANISM="Pavlova gyrans, Strain CCMP608" /LENGTH=354 /DNA_ID=CAMNT_0053417329 /DNA_START=39 /DNA_END=1103 /DNA_ORIENTATION=+
MPPVGDPLALSLSAGVAASLAALYVIWKRQRTAHGDIHHTCRVIRGDNVARKVWRDLSHDLDVMEGEHGANVNLVFVTATDTAHRNVQNMMRIIAEHVPALRVSERQLPPDSTTRDIISTVDALNIENAVHAISVQLPLPEHVDVSYVLGALSPAKDAEGLSDVNFKELCLKVGRPLAVPTTALGAMEVLWRFERPIEGQRAVVIGRSNTVGTPIAQLLLNNNATVTVCHSYTADIEEITRSADILVSTLNRPGTIKGSWLKKGATIIDLGTGNVADPTHPRGRRRMGDVCREEAVRVASFLSPCPNGVDRLILPMLVKNAINCARNRLGLALLEMPPGTVMTRRLPSEHSRAP